MSCIGRSTRAHYDKSANERFMILTIDIFQVSYCNFHDQERNFAERGLCRGSFPDGAFCLCITRSKSLPPPTVGVSEQR